MNIGLIGAENSHSANFCEIFNKEKKHPGYVITHIFGGDSPSACAKLCAEYALTECGSEEDLIAACDAVAVTYRRGSLHFEPVMKALRAGKPVFNDKPFSTCEAHAREIADYAAANNLLICGGSGVKDLPGLDAAKKLIADGATVTISFTANPESEYDGFWFYGIHSVELCVKLLGHDYKSVNAFRTGNSVVASVNYGRSRCVIVNTPDSAGLNVTVMDGDGAANVQVPMDFHSVGPDMLVEMLKTGKPPYEYSFYPASIGLMEKIIEAAGL